MVDGIGGGLLQARDDMGRRGQIGVADAKADDVDASLLDLFFETVEFGEKIWRQQSESGGGLYLHLLELVSEFEFVHYLPHLVRRTNIA
jgi:hypothetical protein